MEDGSAGGGGPWIVNARRAFEGCGIGGVGRRGEMVAVTRHPGQATAEVLAGGRRVGRRSVGHWSRRSFVIGASIGSGSAALAVKHGGADFLLVGNVGRLRMMGASSCACQLPLRDANALVRDFAASEILPAVDMPVFLGACASDRGTDLGALVASVREAGFDGICNFPTTSELGGDYRRALEETGCGFGREVELLARGKAEGLAVLGYARGPDDVERLIDLGADIICVLFDPQLRLTAASSPSELEVAAGLMQPTILAARKRSPGTLCLCGGAVIGNPERMLHLCGLMRADGYIAGSTIDQSPVERFIEERVAEFKAASARPAGEALERGVRELGRRHKLVANSDRMRELYARIVRAARRGHHVLLTGEAGTGKTLICETMHQLGPRRHRRFATVMCDPLRAGALTAELFGAVAGVDGFARERIGLLPTLAGGTLVLDGIEFLPASLQRRLLDVIERRRAGAIGSDRDLPADVTLFFTSRQPLETLVSRRQVIPEFAERLRPFMLSLPPLRERVEDIPLLVAQMLAAPHRVNPQVTGIEHAALRHLQHQPWPGNLRALQAAVDNAALRADGHKIRLGDFEHAAATTPLPTTERERIIDALWRHNFRKAETADFLGIARKTLYNKIKKYDLSGSERHSPGKNGEPKE